MEASPCRFGETDGRIPHNFAMSENTTTPRQRPLSTLFYEEPEIDVAARSHTCRRNEAHLIARGQRRLKVRDGRSWKHYCLECAQKILAHDIAELNDVLNRVNTDGSL